MKRSSVFAAIAVLVLVFSPVAVAQVITGTIIGTVSDETGAVLPGVEITVRNQDTGISRSVVSNDEGSYRAQSLALGPYEVRAELAGFQTAIRTGIGLTVGQQAVVNLELRVGEITEQVFVTGEASLVETTRSTVSDLVDQRKIRDLPLNGRDFTQLALLQAGVINSISSPRSQIGNEGVKITIAGTRITQTAMLLDGTDIRNELNTTPGGASGALLGVETVREFQVITGVFSAEYGKFTGGVINAVSKSGTNEIHGSIFEFHRNSALDARNFFDRDTDNPLVRSDPPPFKRNQFGGSVGGPIIKDQTFFFGSYEGLRERLASTTISNTPNALARQGLLPI
ncbi:MAG: carboxypeptidase regulatory-like domain-containing protein, partial [Acidobacteria bacterium]|nr:carboxypeptidase regulatory-like domain-containing protein [Acidobacteriota bacterium]